MRGSDIQPMGLIVSVCSMALKEQGPAMRGGFPYLV
jgi:hypothetical protein